MVHPRPPNAAPAYPRVKRRVVRAFVRVGKRVVHQLQEAVRELAVLVFGLGPILLNEEQGRRQVAKLRLVVDQGLDQARRQGVCCWDRDIGEQLLDRLESGQREQCGEVVRLASEEDGAGRDGHWRGGTGG